MDEGGSVDEVSLSLKRLCGEGLGEAPSLVIQEDIFGRSLDADISPCAGSFVAQGNPACEGGLIYRGLSWMNEGGL